MLDAIKARAAKAGVNVYQDTGPAPKLAVVSVGEPSYTHATSWPDTQPYLPADQLALIRNFKNQGIPVVVVLTLPRPIVTSDWNDLADAVVVTYRGGEEVGPATAGLLFGDYTPHSHLPWQLPRSLDQIETGWWGQPGRRQRGLGPPVRPRRHGCRACRHPRQYRRGLAGADRARESAVSVRGRHHQLVMCARGCHGRRVTPAPTPPTAWWNRHIRSWAATAAATVSAMWASAAALPTPSPVSVPLPSSCSSRASRMCSVPT